MEYTSIRSYICECTDEYYITGRKNLLSVYDYNHRLIDQFKRTDLGFLGVSQDLQCIYCGVIDKNYIFIWYPYEQRKVKVIFTEEKSDPSIDKVIDGKDQLIIIYTRRFKGAVKGLDYFKSVIDKEKLTYEDIPLYLDSRTKYKYFKIRNKYYYSIQEDTTKDDYSDYFYFIREEDEKEMFSTICQYATWVTISQSEKYALLACKYFKKNRARIEIIDLTTYQSIDVLEFGYPNLYVLKSWILEYDGKAYVIHEYSPNPEDLNNTKWVTNVYSIEDKKFIYEAPFTFLIEYLENKNMLVLQRQKPRIETRFFDLKEKKPSIEEILAEVRKK